MMNKNDAKAALLAAPDKFIRFYLRDHKDDGWLGRIKDRRRTGVVVAVCVDTTVYYGWALCNPRDQFDRHIGTYIALRRAVAQMQPGYSFEGYPERVAQVIEDELVPRAKVYFKQAIDV